MGLKASESREYGNAECKNTRADSRIRDQVHQHHGSVCRCRKLPIRTHQCGEMLRRQLTNLASKRVTIEIIIIHELTGESYVAPPSIPHFATKKAKNGSNCDANRCSGEDLSCEALTRFFKLFVLDCSSCP